MLDKLKRMLYDINNRENKYLDELNTMCEKGNLNLEKLKEIYNDLEIYIWAHSDVSSEIVELSNFNRKLCRFIQDLERREEN